MSFLLSASGRTKYSLQRGKLYVGTLQNLFIIVGLVIAGFVSTYFTVILPGFKMLFVRTGSSLWRGLL